jgi:hypothetical protein
VFTVHSRRDGGFTADILGFFGLAWFGWAQSAPPRGLVPYLVVGQVLSAVVAVVGLVVALREPRSEGALTDRPTRRRYGIVVGVELVLCGAGAAVLGATGAGEYIPVWIAMVVGAHFVPLSPVLHDPGLRPLAVAVVLAALVGLVVALTTTVDASTVVGGVTGLLLLAYAAVALAGALRTRRASADRV